ncbi:hypothetical protein AB0D12_31765 [Streptomyces sp. NPDC048479]|uniref:hypothetical protein n=1 Tax=Streptomyces sp. NPDC048479 TaxID=3154725 RepID=UPI0034242B56
MTPQQFLRAQQSRDRGGPADWTPSDFDSYQVLAENTRKNRLQFRIRTIRRTVRRRLHLAA